MRRLIHESIKLGFADSWFLRESGVRQVTYKDMWDSSARIASFDFKLYLLTYDKSSSMVSTNEVFACLLNSRSESRSSCFENNQWKIKVFSQE